MTYRERRERKAERLREWAAKREAAATAVLASHEVFRGDVAFNTQPGNIPFRARVIAADDRAYASLRKADSMERRAEGIEEQLAGAIYSDDPDAIDQLRTRIAGLEADRERYKRFNASARKGQPDWSILSEDEGRRVREGVKWFGCKLAYPLDNLNGNLARQRARLAQLEMHS